MSSPARISAPWCVGCAGPLTGGDRNFANLGREYFRVCVECLAAVRRRDLGLSLKAERGVVECYGTTVGRDGHWEVPIRVDNLPAPTSAKLWGLAMFKREKVPMTLASASIQLERAKKGEDERPIARVTLACTLTKELTRELGKSAYAHCYDEDGDVRKDLDKVSINRNKRKLLRMSCYLTPDSSKPNVEIEQVSCGEVTISRQVLKRKGKEDVVKLLCHVVCRLDFREKSTRDWLAAHFAKGMFFTFGVEQRNMLEEEGEMSESELKKQKDRGGKETTH